MSYVIEKNIPAPAVKESRFASFVETLHEMEVGDSVLAEKEARQYIYQYKKKFGKNFTTEQDASNENLIRVWRLEDDVQEDTPE